MRRFFSFMLAFVLALELFPSQALAETGTGEEDNLPEYVEGEVLVTTSSSALRESDFPEEDKISIQHTWDFDEVCISEVSSRELSTRELIDTLSDENQVLAVEPNYIRKKCSSNDTYRPYQWYLNASDQYKVTSPGIYEEKIPSSLDSSSPVVAVVDTGIDYTHEDLKEHMWVNPYSSLKGTYGYDFANMDSDPMDDDEDGHGTHCAGIIGAIRDNNTGIAGISDARLMALKIFDSNGDAKDSYIVSAFHYIYEALSLGVNIVAVNCSWGGGGSTPYSQKELIEQIGSLGSLFIFAAGNDGSNQDLTSNDSPYDIQSDYVIKVGASDENDKAASFSNYGQKSVDLFAPGDNILSTINTETFLPFLYDEEKKKSLCTCFSSFDQYDLPLYTGSELGQRSTLNYGEKSFSNQDFLHKTDSGSLCIPISCLRTNASFDLFVDVSNLPVSSNKSYYTSCTFGLEKNGKIVWDTYSAKRSRSSFLSYGGRSYMKLMGLSGDFRSTSKIYIDNAGISIASNDSGQFGKYDMLRGTSMAAPCVSGTVALLSAMYQEDTALLRKARLLKCVRKSSDLANRCTTGGILDLSKLESDSIASTKVTDLTNIAGSKLLPTATPTPSLTKIKVSKVTLNKKKATLRYGKKLKLKASLLPSNASNKKIKWSVSKKKYASVTQKGVVKAKKKGIGHSVKVYAKATDGSGKKAVCTIKIKKKKSAHG